MTASNDGTNYAGVDDIKLTDHDRKMLYTDWAFGITLLRLRGVLRGDFVPRENEPFKLIDLVNLKGECS